MRVSTIVAAMILCQAAPAVALAQGQCEANFQEKGNFFTGTSFSTFQDFTATPDQLFKSALFAIINYGFQVNSQDREMGMISASQTVTGGQGSNAPLNVMIEENPVGSRARVVFTVAGGQMVMEPQRNICDLVRKFGE